MWGASLSPRWGPDPISTATATGECGTRSSDSTSDAFLPPRGQGATDTRCLIWARQRGSVMQTKPLYPLRLTASWSSHQILTAGLQLTARLDEVLPLLPDQHREYAPMIDGYFKRKAGPCC
jgi:hypothetical protein